MQSSADPPAAASVVPCTIEVWIQRGLATWPRGDGQDVLDSAAIARRLREIGASHVRDFTGLSMEEAVMIWKPLAGLPPSCVKHLLDILPQVVQTTEPSRKLAPSSACDTVLVHGSRERTPPRSQCTPGLPTLVWGMALLRAARSSQIPLPPDVFAEVVRRLGEVPATAMPARWREVGATQPPELPRARAIWLAALPLEKRQEFQLVLEEDVIWKTMASWRTSAAQYASALQLWGRASALTGVPAWPPSRAVLDTFCFLFRHGPTLSRYISHIRSALRIVESPLGVLADTSYLVRGASKLSGVSMRYKPRADADQARALVRFARKEVGRADIADSWVVARHFCLRYGAEVVPLEQAGAHSAISIDRSATPPVLTITFFHRKMQHSPVAVVRRCICQLQGRALCGVCVLSSRLGRAKVFTGLSYAEGLAYLKAGAAHLKFERASEWGTHAFRRGWANEALKAGGPTALFYSGGWRGIAAFSYVTAQARGAIEAAEWLVEFSDSSDGEGS